MNAHFATHVALVVWLAGSLSDSISAGKTVTPSQATEKRTVPTPVAGTLAKICAGLKNPSAIDRSIPPTEYLFEMVETYLKEPASIKSIRSFSRSIDSWTWNYIIWPVNKLMLTGSKKGRAAAAFRKKQLSRANKLPIGKCWVLGHSVKKDFALAYVETIAYRLELMRCVFDIQEFLGKSTNPKLDEEGLNHLRQLHERYKPRLEKIIEGLLQKIITDTQANIAASPLNPRTKSTIEKQFAMADKKINTYKKFIDDKTIKAALEQSAQAKATQLAKLEVQH